MRCYLAGPMTGYPLFNFPAFDKRRDELRAAGHIVVSPADLDRAIGFDPADENALAEIRVDDAFIDAAIQRDVAAILQCDAIVMLKGWEYSKGAKGELGVAKWRGLRVFYPPDKLPGELAKVA